MSQPQIRSLKKKSSPDPTTTATKTTTAKDKAETTTSNNPTTQTSTESEKTTEVTEKKTVVRQLKKKPGTGKETAASSPEPTKETTPEPTQSNAVTSSEIPTETDSEPDTQKTVFQALGTLYGTVTKNNEDIFCIELGQKQYRLFFAGYRYAAFKKQYENNPNQPLYLRVYPKYLIIPKKPPVVHFQAIAWGSENQWEDEPGMFTLRGVWQFLPQVRTPVISIYRNKGVSDPTGKFKAAHIPVLMRREDEAHPFKFNPKIAKEDLPPRWFIQAKFRLMTHRDCWGWVEDIEAPTKEIPWYKKPKKEVPGGKPQKGSLPEEQGGKGRGKKAQ